MEVLFRVLDLGSILDLVNDFISCGSSCVLYESLEFSGRIFALKGKAVLNHAAQSFCHSKYALVYFKHKIPEFWRAKMRVMR